MNRSPEDRSPPFFSRNKRPLFLHAGSRILELTRPFGIRVTAHPLAEVRENGLASQRLVHALRTMPEVVVSYKGLTRARERIVELLQ